MPFKLYALSVGNFMHSYQNKLLPNHFDHLFQSALFILTHKIFHFWWQKFYWLQKFKHNLLLPRVNLSSGKWSTAFFGSKVWSSIPDSETLLPTLPLNCKLRNTSYMKKIH